MQQPFQTTTKFEEPGPEASPIPLLEAINNLITAEEEEEGWDLLRDDMKRRGTHSTVGIRLAQYAPPHTMQDWSLLSCCGTSCIEPSSITSFRVILC